MRIETPDGLAVETEIHTHFLNSILLKRYAPNAELTIDWDKYAPQYDRVTIDVNHQYRKLRRNTLEGEIASMLGFEEDILVADVGAGTGNYSVGIAKRYPGLQVAHIDSGPQFNFIAQQKIDKLDLNNIKVYEKDAEKIKEVASEYGKPFDIILMVHALYSMRSKEDWDKPDRVLKAAYDSLTEGGRLFIADIEKEINFGRIFLSGVWNIFWKHGPLEVARRIIELDQAKLQNINGLLRQRDGTYITQRLNGLIDMLEKAGFRNFPYKSEHEHFFRYDNVVIAVK